MKSRLTVPAILLAMTTTANADLIDRGNGMIYDTVQNITWLQDANYAKTEFANNPNRINEIIAAMGSVDGHQLTAGDFNAANGRMSWWGSLAWADQLSYGGYNDWRLPNMVLPDPTCQLFAGDYSYGHGCQANEMGYLFYNYLGVGSNYGAKRVGNQTSVDGISLLNIQPHHWTSMEFFMDHNNAIYFPFNGQGAGANVKFALQVVGAWAVRDGDVQPTPAKSITITHAEWRPNILTLLVQGKIEFDSDLSEQQILDLLDQQQIELRNGASKTTVATGIYVNADGSFWLAKKNRNASIPVAKTIDAKFGEQTSRVVPVLNAPAP